MVSLCTRPKKDWTLVAIVWFIAASLATFFHQEGFIAGVRGESAVTAQDMAKTSRIARSVYATPSHADFTSIGLHAKSKRLLPEVGPYTYGMVFGSLVATIISSALPTTHSSVSHHPTSSITAAVRPTHHTVKPPAEKVTPTVKATAEVQRQGFDRQRHTEAGILKTAKPAIMATTASLSDAPANIMAPEMPFIEKIASPPKVPWDASGQNQDIAAKVLEASKPAPKVTAALAATATKADQNMAESPSVSEHPKDALPPRRIVFKDLDTGETFSLAPLRSEASMEAIRNSLGDFERENRVPNAYS